MGENGSRDPRAEFHERQEDEMRRAEKPLTDEEIRDVETEATADYYNPEIIMSLCRDLLRARELIRLLADTENDIAWADAVIEAEAFLGREAP